MSLFRALHLKPGVPSVIHPRENVQISNAAVDATNSNARTTVKLVANIPAWDGGSKTTAPPGRMSIILGSFTPGQVRIKYAYASLFLLTCDRWSNLA